MTLNNLPNILSMAKDMATQMGGADTGTNPTYALILICEALVERVQTLESSLDDTQAVVAAHAEFTAEAGPRIEKMEGELVTISLALGQVGVPRVEPLATPPEQEDE